jgi:hypothetical protein
VPTVHFPVGEREVLNSASSNVFIHTHFAPTKHVLNRSGEFVDFEEEKDFPADLIQHLHDFLFAWWITA